MKKLHTILGVLAVLLMATATRAQEIKMKADVPFDFVVGGRAYPAGEYALRPMAMDNAFLQITDVEKRTSSVLLSYSCRNVAPSTETKLVFRRIGDEYFLEQVWVEGRQSGRQFPISRTETQLARNHEKAEVVIIAANLSN
jgi:hypothetical protein